MRSKAVLFVALLTTAGLLAPSRSLGGIRPSFSLSFSAWSATDIVVVTEGKKIDGVFKVLEVWKGKLKKGQEVVIKDLAVYADPKRRAVEGLFGAAAKDPKKVTGKRMILFLRGKNAPERWPPKNWKPEKKNKSPWEPAPSFGGWFVSTAWVEEGRLFGFVQVINPGPSQLIALYPHMLPAEMKLLAETQLKAEAKGGKITDAAIAKRVAEIRRQPLTETLARQQVMLITARQRKLDAAKAIKDPDKRAEALAGLVSDVFIWEQMEAIEALAKCGAPAVKRLLRLVASDDKTLLHRKGEIIEAIGKAGGKAVAPKLIAMLEEETEFWRKEKPKITASWWGQQRLSNRYCRTLAVVQALRDLGDPRCRKAVTELRDLWVSSGLLNSSSGTDQMSRNCNAVLHKLDAQEEKKSK